MAESTPNPYADSAPAFSLTQRTTLEADEATRPYAAISKAQLLGLLVAFGDCFAGGGVGVALDASESTRQLHGFLQSWYRHWSLPWRARYAGPDAAFFFTPHERQCIARHKYLKGFDALDADSLLAFVKAIAHYSLSAASVPLYAPVPHSTLNRGPHAHNALIAFRSRPFTERDFTRSIGVFVDGYPRVLEFPILDHVEWVPFGSLRR